MKLWSTPDVRTGSARNRYATRGVIMLLSVALGLAVPAAAGAQPATTQQQPPAGQPAPGQVAPGQSPNPAAEMQKVGFGIAPATNGKPGNRNYFAFTVGPGGSVFDEAVVTNYSDQPLDLEIYMADATNPLNGGFALSAGQSVPRDLGAWGKIAMPAGSNGRIARVPGRSANGQPGTLPLRIGFEVPKNAAPGDYAAGVVVQLNTIGANAQSQNVKLEQRVAARVYARVDGPRNPLLRLERPSPKYSGAEFPWKTGRVNGNVKVINTGTDRLGMKTTVKVSDVFGLWSRTVELPKTEELLPRNKREFEYVAERVPPLLFVKEEITVEPIDIAGSDPSKLKTVSSRIYTPAITWWVAALLLLLLATGVYFAYRAVKRMDAKRKAQAGDEVPPAGPSKTPELV